MHYSLLISSGLWSICAAIVLAWLMVAHLAAIIHLSPNTFKRILQTHIDYIFMGILQILIAHTFGDAISETVGYSLIIGSWMNPALFIFGLFVDRGHHLMKTIAVVSFSLVTYSYFSLALQWKPR